MTLSQCWIMMCQPLTKLLPQGHCGVAHTELERAQWWLTIRSQPAWADTTREREKDLFPSSQCCCLLGWHWLSHPPSAVAVLFCQHPSPPSPSAASINSLLRLRHWVSSHRAGFWVVQTPRCFLYEGLSRRLQHWTPRNLSPFNKIFKIVCLLLYPN